MTKILISAQIRFFLFRFSLFDFFPYLKLPIMVVDPSTPAAPPYTFKHGPLAPL